MRRDSILYSASTLIFALSIIACDENRDLSKNSANVNDNQIIQWAKVYGGSNLDKASSIQQTSDGGYVVAGWTWSFGAGSSDIWVLKLDANGNVQWQKTYGGSGSDWASSIQQTSDGGYVVAGVTRSFGAGSADFWVLKLDANGNIANCPLIGTYSAVVQDTSVTGNRTSITPSDTNVTPTDSNSTVNDTWVVGGCLCVP